MSEQENNVINIKVPIKILHFSDGVLEIYDENVDKKPEENIEIKIDEKIMNWSPWFFYKMTRIAKSVLEGLDYTGEKIADTLGITAPKYAYEINQYKKQQALKEIEDEVQKQNTWKIQHSIEKPITKPPSKEA